MSRSPANAVLDQCQKAFVGPGTLIVTPCGIEDAAFAKFAHPSVGLIAILVSALSKHNPVGIVLGVNIRLVPAFDFPQSLHDWMIRVDIAVLEHPGAVPQKLAAYQIDILGGVEKTVGRAVQWHKSAASCHKVQHGLLLVGFDGSVVGENRQAIEASQFRRIQIVERRCVHHFNPLARHHRLHLPKARFRLVMPLVT